MTRHMGRYNAGDPTEPWSFGEEARLRKLLSQPPIPTYAQMAHILHKSRGSIAGKVYRMKKETTDDR